MFILCSRFVLMHLPGKITYKEIDEMITTVDKGGVQTEKNCDNYLYQFGISGQITYLLNYLLKHRTKKFNIIL